MLNCHRNGFNRRIYNVIDAVSFNAEIRDLAEKLNRKVEESEDITQDIISHPGGFTRAFYKRRMGMAESYIRIAQGLSRSNHKERLHALNTLIEFSFHAKTVSMPLNTARVQIEIMKEAVKNLHNKRRQMEMIADFSLASHGRPAVIRGFLRELKRVEVPEKNLPLKSLDLGWDFHVHDNVSEGRKTPSQLILDAFTKGISSLTLAYYDIPPKHIIFEAMEAGRILGIDVHIGIEFSVDRRRRRRHFLFIPPHNDYDGFLKFFENNCKTLSCFMDGLEQNRERRRLVINQILENFNATHLITLNQGYADDTIFSMPPMQFSSLEKIVMHGQYSRFHLSELLYAQFKGLLHNRVLALKTQYEVARKLHRQKNMTSWEVERLEDAYHKVRKQYTRLNPGELRERYFSSKNIIDYNSAFPEEDHILPELKATGGTIVYNLPLNHGLSSAISTIIKNYESIDRVELMNMRDSMERDPGEITRLCRFVDLINNGHVSHFKSFIKDWHEGELDQSLVENAFTHYHADPLIPLTTSASTGWTPNVPGMGFIKKSSIPKKSRKYFTQTHYRLPGPVSSLILGKGRRSLKNDAEDILSLGKSGHFKENLVGDEELCEKIGLLRVWRYLNPLLKNIFRIFLGFIPAFWWFKYVSPVENPLNTALFYPVLWFCITFFRNVFVDLLAWSGIWVQRWSLKGIDLNNAAQSLLWTGFSVPILGSVKIGFDQVWPFVHEGLVFEWTKFFIICIANGIYISTHNKLRQFDNRVIRGNFFRSILAWPFSAAFASIGNFLGVPSIVQAKFWSDVVAAMIEGIGKFRQMVVLRKRDLLEILPNLESENREIRLTAMLDVLYIWAKRQRGQTCLTHILLGHDGLLVQMSDLLKTPFKSREAKMQAKIDKKEQYKLGRKYSENLLMAFKPHIAQFELTRFILKKYTAREVILLTELIGQNLVPFYNWLKKNKKHIKTQTIAHTKPETKISEIKKS